MVKVSMLYVIIENNYFDIFLLYTATELKFDKFYIHTLEDIVVHI